MFSFADHSLAAGKMHKNQLAQAAYGMILQNHFLFLFLVSKSPL
jgi:hypothetical protein